jgi:hypothetical protein
MPKPLRRFADQHVLPILRALDVAAVVDGVGADAARLSATRSAPVVAWHLPSFLGRRPRAAARRPAGDIAGKLAASASTTPFSVGDRDGVERGHERALALVRRAQLPNVLGELRNAPARS